MEEILKNLSWPHISLIFAVFFVLVFRKPLVSLISRITSIDKTGVKAAATPEAQREEQRKEAVQELLNAIGHTIVLEDLENKIKEDLEDRCLDVNPDTVKVLIKHLAATQILLEFEQIHALIFGSQIFLLKKLNQVVGQGISREKIEAHFEHVQKLYSEELGNWSVDEYLSFLLDRSLTIVKDNVYHLTNLGVEYLTWMARNGKTESKQL